MKVMVVKRQSMCLQVLDTASLTRNAFVNFKYTLLHTCQYKMPSLERGRWTDGQMTQKQYATPLSSKLGAK